MYLRVNNVRSLHRALRQTVHTNVLTNVREDRILFQSWHEI
jgi:hypothetical protein